MSGSHWPAFNAALNATSAALLLGGWLAIRRHDKRSHVGCMLGACGVSLAFLASYLLYHAQVGSVRFQGAGKIRPIYFTLLISHTLLAIGIVPLVIRTLHLGVRSRWPQHVTWGHRTLPLWLYVCGSGILVYWMLYRGPWNQR